jgi:lipopolysaccharide transport protein LptA
MERSKELIIGLIVLVIFGFFIWALLPKDDFAGKISKKIENEKQKADIVFKDSTLAEVYDGIKYWELISKNSTINRSLDTSDLTDVDGLFYDKGKPTLKFLAPSAVWHMKQNDILLNDPIGYDIKYERSIKAKLAGLKDAKNIRSVFHLPAKVGDKFDGYWFSAKNLNWKLSTKKLICNGSITLTKGDLLINAEKLEADVGLEKAHLTGKASGNIYTDGKEIHISADSFLVDRSKDIVVAEPNVIITRKGSKITAGKAVYDQKNGIISLYGDVFLTDDQISAFSRNASYDTLKGKVTLLEKAKAVRGKNEVYGDRILVLLGQNKIMIQGHSKATIKGTEEK